MHKKSKIFYTKDDLAIKMDAAKLEVKRHLDLFFFELAKSKSLD